MITHQTLNHDAEKIRRIVVDRLLHADPVIPLALGRSKILSADYLGKCLTNLGIPVEYSSEVLDIRKYRNPVPFVVSTSGKKKELNSLVEKLKDAGLKPISMTSDLKSELANYTDEEDLIHMTVSTEPTSNSYEISQFFGAEEEDIRRYCPSGTLGEWDSHLRVSYLIGILASELYSLIPKSIYYGDLIIDGINRSLALSFPLIKRRIKEIDSISQKIAQSDYFAVVGEEYSSHVVQSFAMRINQLIPEGEKRKKEVYIINSDKPNPILSPRFFEEHENVSIFGNSGRGGSTGFAYTTIEKIKNLRLRPDIVGRVNINLIGMTFTPNSAIHRECDTCMLLPNQYFPLSYDGTTVIRTYEPLSIVVTDSSIPVIASYQGIPPEKIDLALAESHNKLE